MDDTLIASLGGLNISDKTERDHVNRCLLFELPAELRVEIYELVVRQSPPVIVVDLRDQQQQQRQRQTPVDEEVPYALTLTCKQIHREVSNIRYRVNTVHIFAPVFVPEMCDSPSTNRGAVVRRLRDIAARQACNPQQLVHVKIFLGRMPFLRKMRWMDFFSRWNAVLPAIRALREGVPDLRVAFEAKLGEGKAARFEFGVGSRESVEEGLKEGRLEDGRVAELTEVEEERLGKVRRTLVKTLFREDDVPSVSQ